MPKDLRVNKFPHVAYIGVLVCKADLPESSKATFSGFNIEDIATHLCFSRTS